MCGTTGDNELSIVLEGDTAPHIGAGIEVRAIDIESGVRRNNDGDIGSDFKFAVLEGNVTGYSNVTVDTVHRIGRGACRESGGIEGKMAVGTTGGKCWYRNSGCIYTEICILNRYGKKVNRRRKGWSNNVTIRKVASTGVCPGISIRR